LERGGESGSGSADDGDVTVALDGAVRVFNHWFHTTAGADECKVSCDIRKKGTEGAQRWPS
jgi:hypothetical protein